MGPATATSTRGVVEGWSEPTRDLVCEGRRTAAARPASLGGRANRLALEGVPAPGRPAGPPREEAPFAAARAGRDSRAISAQSVRCDKDIANTRPGLNKVRLLGITLNLVAQAMYGLP